MNDQGALRARVVYLCGSVRQIRCVIGELPELVEGILVRSPFSGSSEWSFKLLGGRIH